MSGPNLIAVAAVLGAAVILLLVLSVSKRAGISPEVLRKLAHIGTGLLALSFPWVFSSVLPVFVVCGLALLLLAMVSAIPKARAKLGSSLYCVGRDSHGEFYFPVAVAVLFALARGDKLLYLIPLLVLTLADAVAAILGTAYGRVPYQGIGGSKSVEGSVAFFTVAFFAVHVPLLLFSSLGREQTLLVAVDIALVVTLLEAVSWRGLDNLIIPLGVLLLLHIYMALPVELLVFRLVGALLLLIFVLLYRPRTTLQDTALVASALVLYASWSAGGWRWFLAPALLFACYSMFLPDSLLLAARKDSVYAVASVSSAGLFWIWIAKLTADQALLFPYTAAYSVHLAVLAWTLSVLRNPNQHAWRRGPVLVPVCWVLMFAPYVWVEGSSRAAAMRALVALPLCAIGFALFCLLEHRRNGLYSDQGWRWLRQAALVLFLTLPLVLLRGAP
jgi:phytol kinase